MSMDRSLKTKAALTRHRNVLSRNERIKRLMDDERWTEGRSIFGLPKIANRKAAVGGKKKEKKAAEGEAAPGAAPAAGAAAPAATAGAAGDKKAAASKAPAGKAAK